MPEAPEPQVVLYGYSERGMVNALCDDIIHGSPSIAALADLLSWCEFPLRVADPPDFSGIAKATFLVEQGFSDFGDLDLLILLDHTDGRKQSVLVEAKVRTDGTRPRCVHGQWRAFFEFLAGDARQRSSLFVQLYRKMRLIRQVESLSLTLPGDAVAAQWRLGSNRVVRQAALLLAEYRANPWYVALVPDPKSDVSRFFTDTLLPFPPDSDLPEWTPDNIRRWGFLTWPDLDSRCGADHGRWRQTTANFEWNRHQIYEPGEPPGERREPTVEVGRSYRFRGELVFVVGAQAGHANCRVVPAAVPGDFFPASFTVAKGLLIPAGSPPVTLGDLSPLRGADYLWDPPTQETHTPMRQQAVPQPPCRVKVLTPGWHTTKVRCTDGLDGAADPTFHVFTRHLRRT
jgi:hypothetical protein